VLTGASCYAVDTVTLGVPEFREDLNVLNSQDPAAMYVFKAVAGRLISPGGKSGPIKLGIIDSLKVGNDMLQWSMRIGTNRFPSGAAILGPDVLFSLARCLRNGKLPHIKGASSERKLNATGVTEEWVILHAQPDFDSKTLAQYVPSELANCPILNKFTSELFGEALGWGTNLVSAGEYYISDFRAGREFILDRSPTVANSRVQPAIPRITIRAFRESGAALEALRVGTIDSFLTKDIEVLAKVEKDETLLLKQCSSYTQVFRKGLSLECPESFTASETKYLS